jgi:glutamyl-tRNA synthetase
MFHVGGARSALFNWCVAKQAGGTFVLRIEDTDEARNRPEWTQGILDALAWLGVEAADPAFEGPYFQSDYAAEHRAAAERLLASGDAYYCDCTREAVEARHSQSSTGSQGYDGFCRDRALGAAPGHALRFRVPRPGTTVVVDLIRGMPTFHHDAIEDFILLRGDGSPVFVLANVVDDIAMGISHVIRGEEHLPNTPKQQLLWAALGEPEPPVWAHVPVLVNEQRKKLSKRRDKVALEQYRDEGYLATAMRNYLMTLGWGPSGETEIVPWEQIVAEFRLEDVNSAPAFFDVKKLAAFNGEYIRALSPDDLADAVAPWMVPPHAPWPAERYDPVKARAMMPHIQQRLVTLADAPAWLDFLFLPGPVVDEEAWAKTMTAPNTTVLTDAAAAYAACPWTAEALKDALTVVGETHGLKLGKAQAPVRVAVTGRTVGPPLFETLEVMGREETLRRVHDALARLGGER